MMGRGCLPRWLAGGLAALALLGFWGAPGPARADYCELAAEIAGRAVKVFPENQEKGVKLFIKALKLCDKPLYSYNLGIAYFRYGNPAEAEKYLRRAAAAAGARPKWLNDCAAVILLRGGDAGKALALAEKAWKQVGDDDPLKPAVAATLAEARLKSGQGLAALRGVMKACRRWPGEKKLAAAAARVEAAYLKAALGLLGQGRRAEGLAVLEQGAGSSPAAARALCLALSRSGRGEKALAQAAKWKAVYPRAFAAVWDEIVAAVSDGLYRRFSAGERAPAMQQAKLLHERYAFDQRLKKSYDELFNAYLNDDATIAIAPRQAPAPAAPGPDGYDVDAALAAAFGGGRDGGKAPVELVAAVDQEKNIPRARRPRPHGIAVVIGNRGYKRYRHGLPDVRYADRDALVMKKYLVRSLGFPAENIIFKLDATTADLNTLFGSAERPRGKLYNYVRGEKGRAEVFVYYVGHGAPSARNGEAYLVPVNAEVDYLETSAYPLSLFYRNLESLPARSLMVVLDACFSGDSAAGPLFKNISPALLKNTTPVRKLKTDSFVLCGADRNQVCAWYPEKRHSLLTYYLFEALQGRADANRDDRITAGELYTYVSDAVSRRALRASGREQQPKLMGSRDLVVAEF